MSKSVIHEVLQTKNADFPAFLLVILKNYTQVVSCGRCRDRTCDLSDVNGTLYH